MTFHTVMCGFLFEPPPLQSASQYISLVLCLEIIHQSHCKKHIGQLQTLVRDSILSLSGKQGKHWRQGGVGKAGVAGETEKAKKAREAGKAGKVE
jgi:hypothetical protein